MIRVIDTLWVEYLTAIEDLRIGIGFRHTASGIRSSPSRPKATRCSSNSQHNILHDIAHTIFQVTLVQQMPVENVFANATTNREEEESSGPRKEE